MAKKRKHANSNQRLYGLVEWVIEQQGTVNQFNEHILMGRVRGVCYRYFITERWAGVMLNDNTSKALQCVTLEGFIQTVEKQSAQQLAAEDSQWVT